MTLEIKKKASMDGVKFVFKNKLKNAELLRDKTLLVDFLDLSMHLYTIGR